LPTSLYPYALEKGIAEYTVILGGSVDPESSHNL
jgi:hypothetical protein